MLAQSFKPAAELGITEPQRDALMKTLVLLETGKLRLKSPVREKVVHADPIQFDGLFNMSCWGTVVHSCGTIACIGGTAEIVGKVSFGEGIHHKEILPPALYELFYARAAIAVLDWNDITPAQAATALRSYLTTGNANWAEAVR